MPNYLKQIWYDMRKRCRGVGEGNRKHYLDRGIRVCDEWEQSFEAFEQYINEHLGARPEDKAPSGRSLYSLDRIDNDLGYHQGNIRWATNTQQGLNTRLHYDAEKRAQELEQFKQEQLDQYNALSLLEKTKLSIEEQQGCLCWTRMTTADKAFVHLQDGSQQKLYTFLWEHHYGPLEAPREYIVNECPNPQCCDWTKCLKKVEREYSPPVLVGQDNPSAKLSEQQVEAIKGLIQEGIHKKEIAKKFSISLSQVYRIASGRRSESRETRMVWNSNLKQK